MLGEGGRGAQLPPTGLLLLSNRQRPPQSSLSLSSPAERQEDLAPQTMQFSFKKLFACYFRCSNCLVQQIEANLRLAEARVGRCEMTKIQGAAVTFGAGLRRPPSAAPQVHPPLDARPFGREPGERGEGGPPAVRGLTWMTNPP